MWWVGTRKGLFEVRDGRVAAHHFPGVPTTMVLPRGDTVWAALEHGHYGPKLHRSDDAGRTWRETESPRFPEGLGESVQTIWALEAAPHRLWCGTLPGGLFTSDDDGASWQLNTALWERPERADWSGGGADVPGIHSVCVDPVDPGRVRIAVSCGGVWQTDDDGQTWALRAKGMAARYMPPERHDDEEIQDPHLVVQSPSNPDVLWCQHHCGVWRSTDGGGTWSGIDVPPSSFGFTVAVHPTDPDTAWFVPAISDDLRLPVGGAVVVARTRDGGQSFDVLRDGLPQQHAYDLVFRHALDIDDTGERLAFGSTTGSMWHTVDGGEHFEAVSHHLPPIYVVRWAAPG